MKKFIIPLFISCIISSCSTHIEKEFKSELSEGESFSLDSFNDFWNSKDEDTRLSSDFGKYDDYFAPTDYYCGLSSSKQNSLMEENVSVLQYRNKYDNITKSTVNDFRYKINGKNYSSYLDTKAQDNTIIDLKALYGTIVSFSVESLTKSTEPENVVEMYTPQLIRIEEPSIKSENELYPLCYYDDFVLKWNADDKNANGVLVVVEWFGTMIFGPSNPESYVRHTNIYPDEGQATLDSKMFEDIPDTGLCYITIYRGNLENVVVDEVSHKLYSETHALLQFILLRNIKEVACSN